MATAEAISVGDVVESIEVRATPERVFKAWTTPSDMIAWWQSSDMFRLTNFQNDFRVGGAWRADGVTPDEKPFHMDGIYVTIDSPHFLSFTWNAHDEQCASIPGGCPTTVEIKMEPTATGTKVSLHHYGFRSEAARARHNHGWVAVLSWLPGYIDSNE